MIPADVRLVMKGWLTNQSQLALLGHLFGLTVALRCRVGLLSDSKVELVTEDGGRIAIELSDAGTEFRYAEPREFPSLVESADMTATQRFSSSVTVLLPSRGEGGMSERESLFLMELVD